MRSLVILAFICILLPKGDAGDLSCYSCDPTNCNKYDQVTCPSGFDNCLSATATVIDKKITLKTCAPQQVCDLTQKLPGITLENVKCCKTNLCNGAESFTLSFVLMFIPLLSSILFY